jgi:hypothetical protein
MGRHSPRQTIKTADIRPSPVRARSRTVPPARLTSTFEDGDTSEISEFGDWLSAAVYYRLSED